MKKKEMIREVENKLDGRPNCFPCNDTGVIETGNNDLPCMWCKKGDTALFNIAEVPDRQVTGEEIKKYYLNNSPHKSHIHTRIKGG